MALPLLLLLWSCSGLTLLLAGSGLKEATARTVPVEFLYPPYNLTYMHYIDTSGVFLRSPNATFSAAVFNAGADSPGSDDSSSNSPSGDESQMSRYFFSVLHDRSRTPVWAASGIHAREDSNRAVRSMMVNASGIYLLADNDGRDTVFSLRFASPPAPATRMLLKVDSSGRLRALRTAYSPTAARATLPAVWAAPASDCDLPLPCGSLGLCTPGNNGSSCMCPDAFTTHTTGGCSPADGSALPVLSDSD